MKICRQLALYVALFAVGLGLGRMSHPGWILEWRARQVLPAGSRVCVAVLRDGRRLVAVGLRPSCPLSEEAVHALVEAKLGLAPSDSLAVLVSPARPPAHGLSLSLALGGLAALAWRRRRAVAPC